MSYASERRAARDAEIAKLLRLGWTNVRICYRMDVSETVVSRVRREIGLSKAQTPLTGALLDKAAALFADGASRNEVARTLGVSTEQLRRAFPDEHWSPNSSRLLRDLGMGQRPPDLGPRRPAGPQAVEGPPT